MKVLGFIGYCFSRKSGRYVPCCYHTAFVCPASGCVFPPSRGCFLDEDLIFMPTSLSLDEWSFFYTKNYSLIH